MQMLSNVALSDPYRLSSLRFSPPIMPFGTWFRAFQQGRETARAAAEQQSVDAPLSSSGDTDDMLALSTHSLLAITSQPAPARIEESNAQAANKFQTRFRLHRLRRLRLKQRLNLLLHLPLVQHLFTQRLDLLSRSRLQLP